MATNDPTTNYSWALPDQGSDAGSWGTMLNTIIGDDVTGLDAVIKAISDVADAALPLAGGVITGDVEFAVGARLIEDDSAMAALEIDFALGNFFSKTLSSGNNTFTMTGEPTSGKVQFITLELTQPAGGDGTVTWPAAVDWQQGIAPTLSTTALGKDIFVFYTRDAGTNVIGAHTLYDPS